VHVFILEQSFHNDHDDSPQLTQIREKHIPCTRVLDLFVLFLSASATVGTSSDIYDLERISLCRSDHFSTTHSLLQPVKGRCLNFKPSTNDSANNIDDISFSRRLNIEYFHFKFISPSHWASSVFHLELVLTTNPQCRFRQQATLKLSISPRDGQLRTAGSYPQSVHYHKATVTANSFNSYNMETPPTIHYHALRQVARLWTSAIARATLRHICYPTRSSTKSPRVRVTRSETG
jgi:hypothetical protein